MLDVLKIALETKKPPKAVRRRKRSNPGDRGILKK
jgi:hypothetical protein